MILLGVVAAHAACGAEHAREGGQGDPVPVTARAADAPPGTVASVDERRGVPTIFRADHGRSQRAPHDSPEAAARWYLARHATLYDLSREALETVYLHRVHDTGAGGIIAMFRQRVDGIPVVRSELKVLMARDLRLLAITGNLHRVAARTGVEASNGFRLDGAAALARALGDVYGIDVDQAGIRDLRWQQGGYAHFDLAAEGAAHGAGIRLVMPARVEPVYFPLPDRLLPAHHVELLATRIGAHEDQGFAYIVAAADGRVLSRQRRVMDDAKVYRVWADAAFPHTPADGPHADYSPHPSGVPDGSAPSFSAPAAITMEGFRASDPWLAADATETVGNNVDAYADHVEPDGFSAGDQRARITAPGVFDHVFDTDAQPLSSTEQIQAAVVQLFYTTNWLHDFFYQAGFDEAAGNGQSDNKGRCQGCLGNDALLAQAQDLGPDPVVRNNANMFVPADGMPPRMQMYLWSVPDVSRSFTAAAQDFATGIATFGPQRFSLSPAPLVLASDGSGIPTDGCEAIQNDVDGAIVLVDRGTCSFPVKVRNAEQGGAIGVIVANNEAGEPPPRLDGTKPPIEVATPALSITREDGQQLKTALGQGAVQARMQREAGVERDGTIDNTIVAHEWGHFLHLRLVACTTQQCLAQSEGWGDFLALLMMVREGDDLDGAFAVGGYATLVLGEDSSYFGLRRAPYSRDPDKNALRFRHITDGEPLPAGPAARPSPSDNAEVHNAGEVWASMLFDGYLGLLASGRHSFEETRNRMARYMVAGMILAPVDPTFTEQRDAILLAAVAEDAQDALILAQGFAGRGAGSCAVSPPRDSFDLAGVVEDSATRARMILGAVTMDDSVCSCDGDGALDAEEQGVIRIELSNPTLVPLRDTTAMVSVDSDQIVFPQGTAVQVDEIAPFGAITIELPVAIEAGAAASEQVALAVSLANADTCEGTAGLTIHTYIDFDPVPASVDTVESEREVWQERALDRGEVGLWQSVTSPLDARDRILYGINADTRRDVALESPPLLVSADRPLVISFEHRHEFEGVVDEDTGEVYEWDGGVLEVSIDGGQTWEDASVYADPGYNGVIDPDSLSYLAGRPGYVRRNPAWPDTDTVTMDFGTGLSGRELRLRFRIATDFVFGAHGWEIDDIAVDGIDNRPFWGIGEDASTCVGSGLPVADAGPARSVASGARVVLDGTDSTDPDGDMLAYAWRQIGVPAVALSDADTAMAAFTAPVVEEDTVLSFELRVSDGSGADTDTVAITVLAPPDGGGADGGPDGGPNDGADGGAGSAPDSGGPPLRVTGGGCHVPAPAAGSPWSLLLFLGIGLAVLRRRPGR